MRAPGAVIGQTLVGHDLDQDSGDIPEPGLEPQVEVGGGRLRPPLVEDRAVRLDLEFDAVAGGRVHRRQWLPLRPQAGHRELGQAGGRLLFGIAGIVVGQ